MSNQRHTPRALTIAGSDSGGGAGIQADLKAFAHCGVHGTSALTAITAQNTTGVWAIQPLGRQIILDQVRAVLEDIGVDAVKIGMLGTLEATLAVAEALEELPAGTPIVVDPVMVSESGAQLLQQPAKRALIEHIIPKASVITPNLPEAFSLLGKPSTSKEPTAAEQTDMLIALRALGADTVVLTGGHRSSAVDLFLDGDGEIVQIPGERHPDGAAHGSGCTHSSVLAAHLASGSTPLQAAIAAREITAVAVAQGLRDIGQGAGPVDVIGLEEASVNAGQGLRDLP